MVGPFLTWLDSGAPEIDADFVVNANMTTCPGNTSHTRPSQEGLMSLTDRNGRLALASLVNMAGSPRAEDRACR